MAEAPVMDELQAAEAFARARECEAAGRTGEAERIYRGVLERFPDQHAALHNLAHLMREAGKLDEAIALQRRAVAAQPLDPSLHNSLGAFLRAAGKLDDAEGAYREAIRLHREYPDAHFNLGLLLEQRGRREDALAAYRDAIEAQPGYVKALVRAAAILADTGMLDDALVMLDQAVVIAPQSFEVRYYRGCVLSALKRHDQALAELSQTRRMNPGSFEAALAHANAQRDAGQYDDALAAYWRLIEQQPGRAATHAELNRLAWLSGRSELFLKSFELARQRIGDDPDLLHLEAAFQMRRERPVAAEQLLRKAHLLAPARPDIAGLLARSLAAQGRFGESYEFFSAAINGQPGLALHRQELGFALLRAGQVAGAIKLFEQSLAVFPFDQLMLAGLNAAYRQLGDPRYVRFVDYSRYVRVYDLQPPEGFGSVEEFNRALALELDALHIAKMEPIDQTLRGGTQTTGRLFQERTPLVQHARRAISAAVADYIASLPDAPDHPMAQRRTGHFSYTGSWSCRLGSGGYHNNHVHPQGWISSAYYVRLPGLPVTDAAKPGWLKLGESNLALGERDLAECFVKPEVGRLVLFPSHYWHGTNPFADSGDRLAIAFDVIPASRGSAVGRDATRQSAQQWNAVGSPT